MELRQLVTFRLAAKTLNFTRTAEMLNYAQSSVTAQIQALEEELGVRLFERLGKNLKLTSAGERLLTYANQILRLVEEAESVVPAGEEPEGTLTIGSVESLCTYRLPPVLQAFRERYPRVRLVLQPSHCADLPRGLADGRFDAVFILNTPVRQPNLIAETLVREELVVLAHPEHPLTKRDEVRPHELAGSEVFLMTEAGCTYRALFEHSLAEAGVHPETVLEFGSVEAFKQCLMAGMGIGVLPRMAVRAELEAGRAAAIPWTPPLEPVLTQMVIHKDKWISPALAALMRTAREVLVGPAAPTPGSAQSSPS